MKKKAKTKEELRGVYSKAVRKFFPDLKKASYNDRPFLAALQLAKRSYKMFTNPSDEPQTKKLKQTFRLQGKSGPRVKFKEIRDELYEWVVDVRSALKARLPRSMLRAKAEQLQIQKIEENPELAEIKKVNI